jgi:OmpA-OmpF porin, OOP family
MRIVIMAVAALALPGWAAAQEMSREQIRAFLSEQVQSEQGFAQPAPPGARMSRTRSATGGPPAPPPSVPPRRLEFRQIQFAFDSADLMPSSRPTMDVLADALAEAMADPAFRGVTFPILGYTDASGSADYNLALSQRRAETVVRYLVARGIPANRLIAIGRGAQDLADPDRPEAPINRRVEVRAKL